MTGLLNNINVPHAWSFGRRMPYLSNLPQDLTAENSTETVVELSGSLDWELGTESTPVAREIPRAEIKQGIISLFQENEVLYPGDIALALQLDYEEVVDILLELEREGAIRAERRE